jgi:phospholipid/cholesterol/gamma-HCH transport system substrate-binding protein
VKRGVTPRLIALGIVVLLGFGYILFDVFGWRLGAQRFDVTVVLARAGGIYPTADVTYRGVAVGKVVSLQLTATNVRTKIAINPSAKIPADSEANVKQLSAVGEQYLDLVPGDGAGGWLHQGSVIPVERTSVPTSIDTALIDFSLLLRSVNAEDVRTFNQFLASGVTDTGDALRSVIVNGQDLVNALEDAQPATEELIVGGNKVLTTAKDTANQFSDFSRSLNQLTGQLRVSNADFQALLANGVAFENQYNQLLSQDGSSLEGLINSSAINADTAFARNPAIQALFQALPLFANDLASVTSGDQIRSELLFNGSNTVCPYLPPDQMALPTQPTGTPNLALSCPLSAPDLLQRGAARAPQASGP